MTVQLTFDDDPPITGLPDEGSQSKQYEATPGLGRAEVTPEPVGSGPVVEADYSLPLITTPDVTTVDPGGTVTVEGSGLATSSSGTLALVAADGTVLVEAAVTADATGAIPETALVVPAEAAEGDYTLTLTGGAVVIDNVTITVGGAPPPPDPVVEPDVTEVEAGGTVTAGGTGFPADTAGTVGLYDTAGAAVVEAPVTTDADGAFAGVALVVPEGTAAGDLALRATVGDATSPDVTVTVTEPTPPPTPTVAATPDTVDSSGDETARTITVTGENWPADTAGTVELREGAPGSGGTSIVTADATTTTEGALPATALVVPEDTAAGDYHVVVTVGDLVHDDTAITVTAAPAPDPVVIPGSTSVEAGTDLTVAGTGFPAETAGHVGLYMEDGTEIGTGIDVTTDAGGEFAGETLTVPAETAAGDYLLRGTVGDVTSPDVTVTVTETPAPAPALGVVPDTVDSAGDEAARTVTVAGENFPAETAGRIGVHEGAPGSGGAEVVGADVTTDTAGAVEDTALIIPEAQAPGDYHVQGVFGDVTVDDVAFTVTGAEALRTTKARKRSK